MPLAELPYTTADLFPAGDFNFHMKFRRGDPAAFYRNSFDPTVLTERRKWLDTDTSRYAAMTADAEPLLEEAIDFARTFGVTCRADGSVIERLCELGRAWEPDILLLRAESPVMNPVLVAGCVCFPSSWSLEEKIGRPLDQIHSPVPTLNDQFANPIQQFLSRIKPGISWERINWGLSRSPELNQHPARELPRLAANVSLEEVWFRAEYQSLVSLPRTGGVLFGIRLAIEPLAKLILDAELKVGLCRAIQTMPEQIARYKGLHLSRHRLQELLN